MALVNIMEEIVRSKIDMLIKDSDCCHCEKCLEDIACIVLNLTPAKYVSTTKGELLSKLTQSAKTQGMVDINIACVNAINFVKAHPQH